MATIYEAPKSTIVIDDFGVEWEKTNRDKIGKGCWWKPNMLDSCDLLPCSTAKLLRERGPVRIVKLG